MVSDEYQDANDDEDRGCVAAFAGLIVAAVIVVGYVVALVASR